MVLSVLVGGLLGGCAATPNGEAPSRVPSTADVVPLPTDARAQLAAAAAAAKDRLMAASYRLHATNRPDRTVVVTLAADRSWRVDIPGGALGGAADIAVVGHRDGVFQCRLPGPTSPDVGCVRVAQAGKAIPVWVDPRIQHAVVDWLDVFIDRNAPLNVTVVEAPAGVAGTCFSVEPTAASLPVPVDAGVYCYTPDGTLTAAIAGFGTLLLAGPPGPAPATVTLPGPIVDAPPLSTAPPPRTVPPST